MRIYIVDKTSKANVKKTECVAETSDITIGFIPSIQIISLINLKQREED